MSDLMRSALDSLLPPGSAWRLKPDGHLDHLLDGIADNAEAVRARVGALGLVRDPWRTPYLDELERDYGISPNVQLADAQRRQSLALVEFARLRRGTIADMQEALDRSGFGTAGYGLHVYPNDPATDPGLFTDRSPQCMCGGYNAYCGYSIDGLAVQDWTGIAHNGTVFCAVGANVCATSTDGITWTTRNLGAGAWKAVAWNGTVFCAVGVNLCSTSPEGTTWAARTIDAGDWRALAWDGTQFCAVGAGPTNHAATSPTGTTWTTQAGITARTWNGIAWNGAVFAAVGVASNGVDGAAATSPTGVTWTTQSIHAGDWKAIAWNGDVFSVMGANPLNYCAYSPNGVYWLGSRIPTGTYHAITWAPALNLFVAVGSGANQCITSPTGRGETWTARTIVPGAWRAIVWSGTLLCAMGAAGIAEATSPDAVTWTARASGVLAFCGYKGGGVFIINGDAFLQAPAYLGCGETEALCGYAPTTGDQTAVCGRYIKLTYTAVVVLSPTGPGSWPFVFFIAGSVTEDGDGYITSLGTVDVPSNQRQSIVDLVMRWKPSHSWAVLMANFA